MHDAMSDRLSNLLGPDDHLDDDSTQKWQLPEGWFSFFLLAVIIFSVVWCLQIASTFQGSGWLSFDALLGLVIGCWASKQRTILPSIVHVISSVLCLALAFWQTLSSYCSGNVAVFFSALHTWFAVILTGSSPDDNTIIFFFSLLLCYLLAYIGALILYRFHLPWLVILINMIVLISNLNGSPDGAIVFLLSFLFAALLLLLRFNLFTSTSSWQRKGLRYADELGWGLMQNGLFVIIAILVLAWILPTSYNITSLWNVNSSPLARFQSAWSGLIGSGGHGNVSNHGNFQNTLRLGGNPNLTKDVVFHVTMSPQDPQYLAFVSYDTYRNGQWSIADAQPDTFHLNKNQSLISSAQQQTHSVAQSISVISPPGEDRPYLIGASDISSLSLPADILWGNGGTIAWLGKQYLAKGNQYTVTSTVSSADETMLRSIPIPTQQPAASLNPEGDVTPPVTSFDPALVRDYTALPPSLDPRIHTLALQIVHDAHAKTMYDESQALEAYLRSTYSYNTNINPPSGEDPSAWFLFDNPQKDGFCNYFSSAMTLMARSLGIPARVIVGYTSGTQQGGSNQWQIIGTDAHSWVQINFAGYGWINFEPSASFADFIRPLPNQFPASTSSTTTSTQSSTLPHPSSTDRHPLNDPANGATSSTTSASSHLSWQAVLSIVVSLILLLALLVFAIRLWWRTLFRDSGLAAQVYGRITLLARWSGVQLLSSQTPYEQVQILSTSVLSTIADAAALERIGDIIVRDSWADPTSPDHPRHNGELQELPHLWHQVQPSLLLYALRHPSFLSPLIRRLPTFLHNKKT